MHVVEGSRVPGASPSLNMLIFKMGLLTFVLQTIPQEGYLPLIKCQLLILQIRDDLRSWHIYGTDSHTGILPKQKEMPHFIRIILSPPLTLFI